MSKAQMTSSLENVFDSNGYLKVNPRRLFVRNDPSKFIYSTVKLYEVDENGNKSFSNEVSLEDYVAEWAELVVGHLPDPASDITLIVQLDFQTNLYNEIREKEAKARARRIARESDDGIAIYQPNKWVPPTINWLMTRWTARQEAEELLAAATQRTVEEKTNEKIVIPDAGTVVSDALKNAAVAQSKQQPKQQPATQPEPAAEPKPESEPEPESVQAEVEQAVDQQTVPDPVAAEPVATQPAQESSPESKTAVPTTEPVSTDTP